MGPALQALEDNYLYLNANYDQLKARYPDSQKAGFATQFVTARSNYWTAISKILHDDDPRVQALVTEMNAAQTALEADVTALAGIATIMNDITTAVQIGTKIAALAV
ncbi:MAG: hypothetical protein ABSE93_03840 [Terriglobia bacterium]|jgi:hypothetical protein